MKTADLGFTSLKVTGGLLPPDFLGRIAALDAGDQDNAAYGLTKSFNIREEIGRFWRIADDLWKDFRALRDAAPPTAPAAVDRWLVPFLTQVLAFTIERAKPVALSERTFPLTHRGVHGTVPMVLCPPAFDLDKAHDAFGEEGRRRTPFGLVQEFLNADDDTSWGLVANGLVLRIARDNPSLTRPAYIEIDLGATFEDGLYADFAAFWLLAHASRFAPRTGGLASSSILERWRGQAQESGERARDKLRDGVTQALITLGHGFVTHPANDRLRGDLAQGRLTAMDLHQELLRLVYRCLFLLTIEDRGLLHPPGAAEEERRLYHDGYSLGGLRERALRPRAFDAFTDLWQGLRITFRALATGADMIAAPALGGLFEPAQCPNLDAAELANADLLTAIKALAFFPSSRTLARINYRDMNTEEFGSVYESLLELHPVLQTAPWRFGYVGVNGHGAKGSERKLSGSYYTPAPLVHELIKSALEPVIRRAASDNPYDQRGALLKLAICDPACGSGHFLLAAARRLAMEIARIDAAPDAPTEAQRQHALREVVRHCIYGVDRNPLAVELCKTALWIETVEPGRPLTFLDHRIRCGDSLIGVFDLKVLEDGVPDGAFKAKTGDDRSVARDVKKRNAAERKGQRTLDLAGGATVTTLAASVAEKAHAIDALPEDEIALVQQKAKRYRRCQLDDPDLTRLRTAADTWCAAFFAPLVAAKPGQPERIPTTEAVRAALAGRPLQATLPAVTVLAQEGRFFHWPLEFSEVFQRAGFDVVLGNPPWERIKLQEQEFFAERDAGIATAANKAERETRIKALKAEGASDHARRLHRDFEDAKHAAEAGGVFVREAGRYPLTATGDINTYAIFAETFLKLIGDKGRAGIIVPTGIATDNTTKAFFDHLISGQRLASLFDFENSKGIFSSVHRSYKFCLLTIGSRARDADFCFFATQVEHLADRRRRFTLSADDIALINPNTRTCPIFRTSYDAELTKTIYHRVPVLIDEGDAEEGNPWGIRFMAMFHMANDSDLFRNQEQLRREGGVLAADRTWTLPDGARWLPLYEAKMIDQYDHRYSDYSSRGSDRGHRVLPELTLQEHSDPHRTVLPYYWVNKTDVRQALSALGSHRFLLGFGEATTSITYRSLVMTAMPVTAVGHKITLVFLDVKVPHICAFYANCNAICLDYIARQKVSYLTLAQFIFKQLPIFRPHDYSEQDLYFIVPRVLELTYTAHDMQPFAADVGYDGGPFAWDPDHRALLRAEIDAYYAYLYGLTRDELRYILDPQDVKGEDWPSETFRVLKNREIKDFGEYRTRRLVLDAFDRFHADGTFDLARIEDRSYFPAMKSQLVATRAELATTKQELAEAKKLLSRADADARPTLFVEGETDVAILAAAWEVFHPGTAMPFKVLAAGGTQQLKALAAPGKALRPILGSRLVMALADNDGEGRDLWRDGALHKGGIWKQQTNGVWWCLLPPTDAFRAAMAQLKIDAAFWPFTIENAFSPEIRAAAAGAGAYALAKTPQSDLMTDGGVRKRVLEALFDLPADDPLSFWLRAPAVEAKIAFAAWVTAPERRTAAVYAAFAPVLAGLAELVAKHAAATQPPAQARLL